MLPQKCSRPNLKFPPTSVSSFHLLLQSTLPSRTPIFQKKLESTLPSTSMLREEFLKIRDRLLHSSKDKELSREFLKGSRTGTLRRRAPRSILPSKRLRAADSTNKVFSAQQLSSRSTKLSNISHKRCHLVRVLTPIADSLNPPQNVSPLFLPIKSTGLKKRSSNLDNSP